MIRRVVLKNWKSHLDSVFEFPKGVNIILGINGSGKSSIFEAICFGLYGTTPDLQSKKIKLDDVIMRKPYQRNEAEVLIEFECEGKVYTVKRVIKAGRGSTAELREDGKLIEIQSSQRVNEIIEEKLKTSFDLFSKIIYSKQNSLDYFLNLSPSERKKKIDEILMIENFEKARSSCTTLIGRLEERILEKEKFLGTLNIERLNSEKNNIEKEIKEIENWLIPVKSTLAEISTKRVLLEEEYERNKKIKESLEGLRREEASISSLISQISADVEILTSVCKGLDRFSVLKELEKIKKEIKDLEKYVSDLKISLDKKINRKSEISSSISFSKKKIEEIEKELLEIKEIESKLSEMEKISNQKVLEESEKNLLELKSKISSLAGNIESLEESINKLMSAESKCPVCDSKLSEEKKKTLIEKKREEIENTKKEIENYKIKVGEEENRIRKIKEDLKKIEQLRIRLSKKESLEKDLEFYKNQQIIESDNLISLEKEIEEYRRDLEEKEKILKDSLIKKNELELALSRINEYEEKVSKLGELKNRHEKIKQQIKDLEEKMSFVPLEQLSQELMKLVSRERELAMEIRGKEELKARLSKSLEEVRKQIEFFEKIKQEIENLRRIVIDLKVFKEALKIAQEKLREEFVQAVNSYMSLIWSNLYPYKDFATLALKIEEGDYSLQLQERSGKWVSVEGIASGGERSLAALALRIAFSLTLSPKLKILVLDEPTHNLDSNSVEELAKVLRESVSEFLDQVFIITHDEKLENAVTGKIYKLERNKEVDEFTRVIEI